MGSLCSKHSTHSGGHTVLGSQPGSTLDAGTGASPRNETAEQRRERMLAAAKGRQQKDIERLVNKKNPAAGRLASKVNKPYKPTAQKQADEPLTVRVVPINSALQPVVSPYRLSLQWD
ncbi:hypothetical protein M0805_004258 [Coniferiporia weirii]|nr:hypothetical protein M0805_004258 [Coniferiporia weirii]